MGLGVQQNVDEQSGIRFKNTKQNNRKPAEYYEQLQEFLLCDE